MGNRGAALELQRQAVALAPAGYAKTAEEKRLTEFVDGGF
jgi:hypothetical protein